MILNAPRHFRESRQPGSVGPVTHVSPRVGSGPREPGSGWVVDSRAQRLLAEKNVHWESPRILPRKLICADATTAQPSRDPGVRATWAAIFWICSVVSSSSYSRGVSHGMPFAYPEVSIS
jgi:hypothetical protein